MIIKFFSDTKNRIIDKVEKYFILNVSVKGRKNLINRDIVFPEVKLFGCNFTQNPALAD